MLARPEPEVDASLRRFARELGLLFQIVDDILDVEGSEDDLGKAVGADARRGKVTYVSTHGIEGARRLAGEAHAARPGGAGGPAGARRGPRGHRRSHLREARADRTRLRRQAEPGEAYGPRDRALPRRAVG